MSFKLARLVGRGLTIGEPLPDVFSSLDNYGIKFYRGGVTLIGGTPGSMKTMFIGELIDRMKVPTLYVSNDSNEATIASRFIARRVGQDSKVVRERIYEDPEWAAEQIVDMDWVRWNFSPSPTLEEIEEEVMAFEELWGEFPHLVVVDILMKVDYVEDGGGTDESIVRYLDKLARETNSCIIIACHTSENVKGEPCQPLSAFLNKIGKIPIMALTTARQDDLFFLAPVKVRDGVGDATGETYLTFIVDPPTATMEET